MGANKSSIKIIIVFFQGFFLTLALIALNDKGLLFWLPLIILLIITMHLDDAYIFPKMFKEKAERFDALKEAEKYN